MPSFILLSFLFVIVGYSYASEFFPEDQDLQGVAELLKVNLEDTTNFQEISNLSCSSISEKRPWSNLAEDLNFEINGQDCVGVNPKSVRKKISKAYRDENWKVESKKMYEELKNDKNYHQYRNCKFVKRNIERDSKACVPSAKDVFNPLLLPSERCQKISGRMGYVGFVYLPYRYSLCPSDDGKMELIIKIFFKKEIKKKKQDDLKLQYYYGANMNASLQSRLDEAAAVWNKSNPMASAMKFKFIQVLKAEEADFQVDLNYGLTRGPYCREWSNTWGGDTMAHEIGHMMGLDDEYNQVVGSALPLYHMTYAESYCDPESIMCDDATGRPQKYHYYMIMRRFLCQPKNF
jgi:hypothetical protein